MATEDADTRAQLREARQLITRLTRTCRQTIAYLDGVSVMDENKLRRLLRDVATAGDRFLSS